MRGNPGFFSQKNPFREISETAGLLEMDGGNIFEFEEKLGVSGDAILYVGDHIYGDMLKTKQTSAWRTLMIIPEIENELAMKIKNKSASRRLLQLMIDKERSRAEARKLRKRAFGSSQDQGRGIRQPHNREVAFNRRENIADRPPRQVEHDQQMTRKLEEIKLLEDEIDMSFNPFFGELFREKTDLSLFAEQMTDFACIYTSRVTNILHYPPDEYFHIPIPMLPHDREPELVNGGEKRGEP
ncbi:MAG: HAD-IG family 5'-nucleotidase [Marinilabiliales bacterium]|nr:HAD-IG family 5'-nucleotidase [Marinilabiliales bacterium]